jgi:hypothetical protein
VISSDAVEGGGTIFLPQAVRANATRATDAAATMRFIAEC